MFIDSRLEFSIDQALTANAASTNSIDLGQARKIGPGSPMWVVIVAKAALGGTSPTFQAHIETDDNSGFSSARAVASTEQRSAMAIGDKLVLPMPYDNEQYLRLDFDLGGTSPTITVDAFLTSQEPESWEAQPDALSAPA